MESGKAAQLTPIEVAERLGERPGWSLEDEKWIVKKYRFPSFPDSIAFVNRVADIAEKQDHHPMIGVDYRTVTLRLTSWHTGGLTALDFICADRFDEAFAAARAGGDQTGG